MPNKDFFSSIPRRTVNQDESQYAESTRQYIKKSRPDLDDDTIEMIVSDKLTEPVADVVHLVKKNETKEAIKKMMQFQSPTRDIEQQPKNPMEAAKRAEAIQKVIQPVQPKQEPDVLESLLATSKEGEPINVQQRQTEPIVQSDATQVVKPSPNQVATELKGQKTAQSIREYLADNLPKINYNDEFDVEAEKALPEGTPEQRRVYADFARTKVNQERERVGKELAGVVSDKDFKKHINFNDLVKPYTAESALSGFKDVIGAAISDESKLASYEYLNSPEFKEKVLSVSGNNPSKMKEAAQAVLQDYNNRLDAHQSALQRKSTQFADYLAEKYPNASIPISTGIKYVSGFGKGLESVGDVGSAVIQTAIDAAAGRNPWMTESFSKHLAQNQAKQFVPEFRSEKENEVGKFVGDVAESYGDIQGALAPIPKIGLANSLRKVLGYGTTDATAIAALDAGKTATSANKTLSGIQNLLKTKSAASTAEVLDNALTNYAAFGAPTYSSYKQRFKDAGFSDEEAASKAQGMTLVNMVGLALPNVLHKKQGTALDEIYQKGGIKNSIVGGLKQGKNFAVDMAALRGVERAALGEDFDIGEELKSAAHDFVLGGVMGYMNAPSKGVANDIQKNAIGQALENRAGFLAQAEKQNPELSKQTDAFLNTIEPYYKEAKEVGIKGNPVDYAIAKARAEQATKELQSIKGEEETIEFPDGNKVTQYKHSDGVWYDYPEAKFVEKRKALTDIIKQANKDALNIQRGTYTGDNIVSSKEIKDFAAQDSPNGTLKEGQAERIDLNAPYRAELIDLNKYKDVPEIQVAMEQLKGADGKSFEAIQPVIDSDGTIIDGAKTIAKAILDGGSKIKAFKPVDKEEIKQTVNETVDETVGDTEADFTDLDETATIALKELRQVYDNHLEQNENDVDGAMRAVAKDLSERGYDKDDAVNMLRRVNNGAVSEPIAEGYYNESVPKVEEVKFKVVPAGEEGFFKIVDKNGKRVEDAIYFGEEKANEALKGMTEPKIIEQPKTQKNDSENIERVSGEVGEGQEPIQANVIESGSVEKTEPSGDVQGNEQETVKPLFEKSIDLYDKIMSAEGASKKRNLTEERKEFLEQNPSVKRIDDNIRDIYKQLSDKEIIKKKGDCP